MGFLEQLNTYINLPYLIALVIGGMVITEVIAFYFPNKETSLDRKRIPHRLILVVWGIMAFFIFCPFDLSPIQEITDPRAKCFNTFFFGVGFHSFFVKLITNAIQSVGNAK